MLKIEKIYRTKNSIDFPCIANPRSLDVATMCLKPSSKVQLFCRAQQAWPATHPNSSQSLIQAKLVSAR
jgi:hypothetical protein